MRAGEIHSVNKKSVAAGALSELARGPRQTSRIPSGPTVVSRERRHVLSDLRRIQTAFHVSLTSLLHTRVATMTQWARSNVHEPPSKHEHNTVRRTSQAHGGATVPVAHPLESYTFDISAYVDAALELDVQAREQWLSEMHNCAPRVVARLRAYLIE
jgi:hypothetical protein